MARIARESGAIGRLGHAELWISQRVGKASDGVFIEPMFSEKRLTLARARASERALTRRNSGLWRRDNDGTGIQYVRLALVA